MELDSRPSTSLTPIIQIESPMKCSSEQPYEVRTRVRFHGEMEGNKLITRQVCDSCCTGLLSISHFERLKPRQGTCFRPSIESNFHRYYDDGKVSAIVHVSFNFISIPWVENMYRRDDHVTL